MTRAVGQGGRSATSPTFPLTFDGVSRRPRQRRRASRATPSWCSRHAPARATWTCRCATRPRWPRLRRWSPATRAGNQGNGALGPATIDAAYLATPLAANVTLSLRRRDQHAVGLPGHLGRDGDAGQRHRRPPTRPARPCPTPPARRISFDGIRSRAMGAPAKGDTFTIEKNVARRVRRQQRAAAWHALPKDPHGRRHLHLQRRLSPSW